MQNTVNRDKKFATSSSVQGGLYDVLIAVKNNIMRSLNVATFAEVKSINSKEQTVTVKPFPLIDGEKEKNIVCFSCMIPNVIKNDTTTIEWLNLVDNLEIHDIVLVVFVNRNSSQALQQAKRQQTLTNLSENNDLHSDKFGIIVGLCYKFNR